MGVHEGDLAESNETVNDRLHLIGAQTFVAADSRLFQEWHRHHPSLDVKPPHLVEGERCEVLPELRLVSDYLSRGVPPTSPHDFTSGEMQCTAGRGMQVVVEVPLASLVCDPVSRGNNSSGPLVLLLQHL